MPATPLITLLSDFGLQDAFVGTMKGVIATICPGAQTVDLTHGVPAQDVQAGALLLEESYGYFPQGTVHLAVVDPGVGSARKALAIRTERYYFVGPDNGLLSLALAAELQKNPKHEVRELNNPKFQLQNPSSTFHGRDIFAPAAAWLARGISFMTLGDVVREHVRLDVPRAVVHGGGLDARVVRVDGFGNLITSITREQCTEWNPENRAVAVVIGTLAIRGISRAYSDVPAGHPVAYFGSSGRLELGLSRAHAASAWTARQGDPVRVTFA